MLKDSGDHHAQAGAKPETHAGASCTAITRLLGRIAHGLGGLVFHELIEVAYRAHPALLIDHLLDLGRRCDGVDEEILEKDPESPEILLDPGLERYSQLVVVFRKVEDGVEDLADHVVKPRDDDLPEVIPGLFGIVGPLGAYQGVDEKKGLNDPHRIHAEGPQPHQAQRVVPERHGLLGAPLHVHEALEVGEVDFDTKWALKAEREAQNPGHYGKVKGGKRVPSRPQEVKPLAVPEEHGRLIFPDDQLGTEFYVGRSLFGDLMHHLLAGFIEPFQDFHEDHDCLLSLIAVGRMLLFQKTLPIVDSFFNP